MGDKGKESPIPRPDDRVVRSSQDYLNERLNQGMSRRSLVAVLGKIAAVGGVVLLEAKTGIFRRAVESVLHNIKAKETEDYWGQPVEGSMPETLITVPVEGGYDGVPVRLRPTQAEKDLIGFAKFGSKIDNAQQVFGGVYAGYPENRGRLEKDGKFFGTWYKVENIPVKDKDGNEKVVDGYIAGNYLREPTKAELQVR